MRRTISTRTVFIVITIIFLGLIWLTMEHRFHKVPISEPQKNIDLRLTVIVYNRAGSVAKCLQTLNQVDYLGDNVHIDVWIDRSTAGIIDEPTYKAATSFSFSHGTILVHNHTKHVGLYGQWIDTWNPTKDSKEIGVIIEDDLNLSPFFYRYLKAAHKKYGKYPKINGFALQGRSIKHGGRPGRLLAPAGNAVFLYPILGTWGFSPKANNWVSFVKWFKKASLDTNFIPQVPKIMPSGWYLSGKTEANINPKMWSMWHIYYAYKNRELTIYKNSPDKLGFAINRMEKGLHYRAGGVPLDQLITTWNKSYVQFPDQPVILDFNGNMVSDEHMAWGIHTKL